MNSSVSVSGTVWPLTRFLYVVRVSAGVYFLFVPVLAALVSLPISLNGLGVREGAGVVLFQSAGMTREQAFTVPFLTYLISVMISLLGGLIFVSRQPRQAIRSMKERRRSARATDAEVGPLERKR